MNLSEVPILVTGFNRPHLLDNVLQKLQDLGQQNVWIALDGPRSNVEIDKHLTNECLNLVLKSRVFSKERSLFRKENAGCKYGMADAITWFFNQNEMGIVIEDDLVFERDFLQFCFFNLERYRLDISIGSITGYMPLMIDYAHESMSPLNVSHRFFSAWGWASWADRWSNYDVNLRNWRNALSPSKLFSRFALQNPRYWIRRFDELEKGLIDTWDFQFLFTHFSNNWKVIAPIQNLVGNVGFGHDATHTKAKRRVAEISQYLPKTLSLSNLEAKPLNLIQEKEYLRIQFGF